MAYPFSVARAVLMSNDNVVCGKIDNEGFIESDDGHFFKIKPPISFNTGLLDHNSDEIFTGDLLRHFRDPLKQRITYEVEYLVEEGALFIKHTEQKVHYRRSYLEFKEDYSRVDQTDIIHDRLTKVYASQYVIVGNIYTGVILPPTKVEGFDNDD